MLGVRATQLALAAFGLAFVVQTDQVAASDRRGARELPPVSGAVRFRSRKDAYEQGLSAFRSGDHHMAVPALTFAAENGWLPAKFYLAQIFADNSGPYTNHGRAYRLYLEIVETTASDTDSDDHVMAPILSQSMVALGRYIHSGLSAIGLKSDPTRAAEFFAVAASNLNDEDAQFELAKRQLVGDGIPADPQLALHFLSALSKRGHYGAQAVLAGEMARGKLVKRNMIEALALIEIARRNAPERERFWVEEIHQKIYCGVSPDVQRQASGLVAGWQKKYGRASPPTRDGGLGLVVNPRRVCKDGTAVPDINGRSDARDPARTISSQIAPSPNSDTGAGGPGPIAGGQLLTVERGSNSAPPTGTLSIMQGGTSSPVLRSDGLVPQR